MRVLLIPLILAACVDQTPVPYARVQPQSNAEIRFAMDVLDDLQLQSFDENREYCGYIGLDDAGDFVATKATKGRQGSCRADNPPAQMRLIASYHTHGGYSDDYDSEVPSISDLEGDRDEGVDGYVATPGGRVWYNNTGTMTTVMLCDVDCISSDNDFEPSGFEVSKSYTLEQLAAFFE